MTPVKNISRFATARHCLLKPNCFTPRHLCHFPNTKYHFPNTTFYNIDICPQANALASRLISCDPDLSRRITFRTTDLFDMTTEILSVYEVIFLAALVGLDKEAKVKSIEHLEKHMASGALLMLRSAHGLKAFLCHIIDPCDLIGFGILKFYRIVTNEFVNLVVIARKLGGQTKTGMNNEAFYRPY